MVEEKKIEDLKSILKNKLKIAQESQKKAILFLTGGASIKKLYRSDDWFEIFNSFHKVCFADERVVEENNQESNIGNFLRITKINSKKVLKILDNSGNLREGYSKNINHFLKSKDYNCYAISGFGLDGHFWSLFTQEDLNKNAILQKTTSPNHRYERITLGSKAFELLDDNYFFATKEKYEKYINDSKGLVRKYLDKIFIL